MASLRRAAFLSCLIALVFPAAASAGSPKKAIWGPVDEFSKYADLGVGIYQYTLYWDAIAPTRPSAPKNPGDGAYHWPSNLDSAAIAARRAGIRVSVLLHGAPSWAN